MVLDFSSAAFFFLVGFLLVCLGYFANKNSRVREILLISGGVVFLVTGVWTLSGQVIQQQGYVLQNYTYANFTNGSVNVVLPALVNTTTVYIPLTGGTTGSLATAGLFGFLCFGLGIAFIVAGFFEALGLY